MVSPPAPLARVVVVTDCRLTKGRSVLDVLAAAVQGGLRGVIVRDKHLPPDDRRRLVEGAMALVDPVGGVVLVGSDPSLGGHGVHLGAADPFPAPSPGRLDRWWVGRSCHSAADVARAAAEGCDYVTLSPVFPSPSKPGYGPPLGLGALGGHAVPVLALGGVDPANARACRAAGAYGVAVMGAAMGADDPARVVAALCRAVADDPPAAGVATHRCL